MLIIRYILHWTFESSSHLLVYSPLMAMSCTRTELIMGVYILLIQYNKVIIQTLEITLGLRGSEFPE